MKTIDLTELPTEFRAVCWNDGWEFEAPLVVYHPAKYAFYKHVGSAHEAESAIEDITMRISLGMKISDGGLKEDCEWRGWSRRGFARRKAAHHVVIKGYWQSDKDGPAFTQTSMDVTWGPPKK